MNATTPHRVPQESRTLAPRPGRLSRFVSVSGLCADPSVVNRVVYTLRSNDFATTDIEAIA